jgi:hypothetical protein
MQRTGVDDLEANRVSDKSGGSAIAPLSGCGKIASILGPAVDQKTL